ncbi:translocation and assembly module lipoprotein TamL [Prevotella dentasini]
MKHLLIALLALALVACSTTSAIPEGEQLYTGMETTRYSNYKPGEHYAATREELDVVLATKPNAALFGSPSVRSPFPVGLWVWNAFVADSSSLGRFLVRAFGSAPVLMSSTTPDLRVSVGENLLSKRGYFNGKISYQQVPQKNPKKMKLRYSVDMGHLWTLGSIRHTGFPPEADSLITADSARAVIREGDAFDVATLEQERQRITTLLRDNGYYYYQNSDASYLADTTLMSGKAVVQLQLADSVKPEKLRKWTIGNLTVNFQRSFLETLSNEQRFGPMLIRFNGSRPPVRLRALANSLRLRRGDLYSYARHEESQNKLNATGIFSSTNFTFTPRDSSDTCRILDMTLNCMFDRPYDFYVEAYGKGKTSGKYGPELIVGLAKRNAFRGGELLNIRLHGSYEWSSRRTDAYNPDRVNDYAYGAEASLRFPRIVNPFQTPPRKRWARIQRQRAEALARGEQPAPFRRREFYDTPTTTLRASADVVNRANYFKRHVVSGELSYNWKTSERSEFTLTPLSLTYEYMHQITARYDELADSMPYLRVSMADQFIPKASFAYTYQSPASYRSPIKWQTTVSEASNLLSLGFVCAGRKWSERDKEMFKNPFAQFVKIETNFTKLWAVGGKSSVAAHANAGAVWTYGNSTIAPYTEQFYVGGANSVRAFNAREIGPGRYRSASRVRSYVEQTGDIKVQLNLEYRPHLMGSLYGAVFLDAGNVWTMHDDNERSGSKFSASGFLRQMALGTGVGLRYDLGFFMIRVDWGVGLHVPYETGRTGFYNVDSFRDAQTLHLAIGLPF